MIVCNHCDVAFSDIAHCMRFCTTQGKQVPIKTCMLCSSRLYRYKDLDIGDFFYDKSNNHYGIKLSSCRAFNLDYKCVYGFSSYYANNSNEFKYLKCQYEVW